MRILTLVGPKGCGKSSVGRAMEREVPNATFLDVERIAIDFVERSGGSSESFYDPSFRASFFDRIREEIDELARALPGGDGRILVFESTGAAPETKAFLEGLKHFGPVYLVRIRSSASTCAKRIIGRDNSKQVDVSTEMIERVHAATEALDWDWDLELVNENSASMEKLVESIAGFLRERGNTPTSSPATSVPTRERLVPPSVPTRVFQDDLSPSRGNALQAAVASVFGTSLQSVPNFIESPLGYEAAIAQFYRQGGGKGECVKMKLDGSHHDNEWSYVTSEIKHLRTPEEEERFDAVRDSISNLEGATESHTEESRRKLDESTRGTPDGMPRCTCKIPEEFDRKICILRGKSPRGDFGHVVVAEHVADGTFEMLHDPHPDGTFLDATEAFGWCLFFA